MTERSTPATIRDVALRAGVSTATVSRVLAGIGNPKPDTAAAVMNAAEELGYRPSGVARSLRMKRTGTLGLIVTDIQNPFFPELVQAADLAARSLGYSILLGSAAYDEHRTTHYLDLMVDRRVDGLIIASSQLSAEGWRWLLASPVPVVVVNAEPPDLPLTVITSDNLAGEAMAVAHLVGLGHRRIAYIRGAESFTQTGRGSWASGRRAGPPHWRRRIARSSGATVSSRAASAPPRRSSRWASASPRSPATTTSPRSARFGRCEPPAGASPPRSASSDATTSPPLRGSTRP
jgi:LacI family transcriptional regulator